MPPTLPSTNSTARQRDELGAERKREPQTLRTSARWRCSPAAPTYPHPASMHTRAAATTPLHNTASPRLSMPIPREPPDPSLITTTTTTTTHTHTVCPFALPFIASFFHGHALPINATLLPCRVTTRIPQLVPGGVVRLLAFPTPQHQHLELGVVPARLHAGTGMWRSHLPCPRTAPALWPLVSLLCSSK